MSAMQNSDEGEKPLKVLIAGAGLAGLAVAIALRRQGHHVEVILLFYIDNIPIMSIY